MEDSTFQSPFSQNTSEEHSNTLRNEAWGWGIVLGLILLFSLVTNAWIISVALCRTGLASEIMRLGMVVLSFSDVFHLVLVQLPQLIEITYRWSFGRIYCKIFKMEMSSLMNFSVFVHMVIAYFRYKSITGVPGERQNTRFWYILCVVMLIYSHVSSVPLLLWEEPLNEECSTSQENRGKLFVYQVVNRSLHGILPTIWIATIYIAAIVKFNRMSNNVSRISLTTRKTRKLVKICAFTAGAFVLTKFPISAFYLLFLKYPDSTKLRIVSGFLYCVYMTGPTINFIIYITLWKKFRMESKEIALAIVSHSCPFKQTTASKTKEKERKCPSEREGISQISNQLSVECDVCRENKEGDHSSVCTCVQEKQTWSINYACSLNSSE